METDFCIASAFCKEVVSAYIGNVMLMNHLIKSISLSEVNMCNLYS